MKIISWIQQIRMEREIEESFGKDSDRATERVAKNSKKSGGYQTAAASNG